MVVLVLVVVVSTRPFSFVLAAAAPPPPVCKFPSIAVGQLIDYCVMSCHISVMCVMLCYVYARKYQV